LWLFYLMSDILAVVAAYIITLYLRFFNKWGESAYGDLTRLFSVKEPERFDPSMPLFYLESAPRIILILAVTICFLYGLFDLYAGRRFLLRRPVGLYIILANLVALGLFYSYFYARFNVFHPRTVFVSIAFFNMLFCSWFRIGLDRLLWVIRRDFRYDECRAILIGSDDSAGLLDRFISTVQPQGVRVVDRMALEQVEPDVELTSRIRDSVVRNAADMIICADSKLTVPEIMEVIQLSEEMKVAVKVLSREMDVLRTRARLTLDVMSDTPLVHFAVPPDQEAYCGVKRLMSAVFAALLLALAAPVLLVIALLIKVTSPGPVFFVQERIGVNRSPFQMFKFRTMHYLADELQAQVEEFNESGAGLFKIRKDPRITGIGRFLRRFSLDELPQLINVIRGEMAFIGPRPLPRRDFEHYYEDWHYIRHGGLPGLTCLWQISGRSDVDFHNMCILDIYYLRNRSMMLDLKILMKTVVVVLFARGAY